MNIERTDVVWIEARSDYSIDELVELSGLPAALLADLVDIGAMPVRRTHATVSFAAESVSLARAAQRLREHFELDEHGLAVAVSLLRRVRVLEAQVTGLEARAFTPPN